MFPIIDEQAAAPFSFIVIMLQNGATKEMGSSCHTIVSFLFVCGFGFR